LEGRTPCPAKLQKLVVMIEPVHIARINHDAQTVGTADFQGRRQTGAAHPPVLPAAMEGVQE